MKPTVLYVDDEIQNRLVFEEAFGDEFGVLTAEGAVDALAMLESREVPVVVTDQRMPGMTGVQLLSQIRTLYPRVKRLLLTGYADAQAMLGAINAGQVFYFMHKPWEHHVLAGVLRDAVEAYHKDHKLRQQAEQLERQNHELLAIQEQLQQAGRFKDEFLASVSHEIRTPLTSILGYAALLNEGDATPWQQDRVQTILRNGEGLLAIVNGILDLSKIEAGRLDVDLHPCDPIELAKGVVELMSVRAAEKGLELAVRSGNEVPAQIHTDQLRVRQVLINLVGNAIKFTEQGRVELVLNATPGGTFSFEVCDTGIGMAPEQLERLFQPFVQVDRSSTRRFSGTGLGLSISRRLARILGGELTVESVPGVGSRFELLLPGVCQKMATEAQNAAVVQAAEPAPPAERRLLEGKILLAEDGIDNQRLVSHLLRKRGATVDVAENGQMAVEMVRTAAEQGTPYDVILMDMQMPLVNGYEATRMLRAEGILTPVVALTAHAMIGDREKCLAAGCSDYQAKPLSIPELTGKVARWLSISPHLRGGADRLSAKPLVQTAN